MKEFTFFRFAASSVFIHFADFACLCCPAQVLMFYYLLLSILLSSALSFSVQDATNSWISSRETSDWDTARSQITKDTKFIGWGQGELVGIEAFNQWLRIMDQTMSEVQSEFQIVRVSELLLTSFVHFNTSFLVPGNSTQQLLSGDILLRWTSDGCARHFCFVLFDLCVCMCMHACVYLCM